MTNKENELIRRFTEIVLEERIDIDELCKYSKEEIINMLECPVYFKPDTTRIKYMEINDDEIYLETTEPCKLEIEDNYDYRHKQFVVKVKELSIDEL